MVRQVIPWLAFAVGSLVMPHMVAKRVLPMLSDEDEALASSLAEEESSTGTGNILNPEDIQEILKRSRPLYAPRKGTQFIKAELSSRGKSIGFFLMGCKDGGADCYQGEWYQMLNKGGGMDVFGFSESAYTLDFLVSGSFLIEFDDDMQSFQTYPTRGKYFLAEAVDAGVQLAPGGDTTKNVLCNYVAEWFQKTVPGVKVTVTASLGAAKYGPYLGKMHSKAIVFHYRFFIPEALVGSKPPSVIQNMMATVTGPQLEEKMAPMIRAAVGSDRYPGVVVPRSAYHVREPQVHGSLLSHTTLNKVQQDWIAHVYPPLVTFGKVGAIDLEIIVQQVDGIWMATEATFSCHEGSDLGKAIGGVFKAMTFQSSEKSPPATKTFVMDQGEMQAAVAKAKKTQVPDTSAARKVKRRE